MGKRSLKKVERPQEVIRDQGRPAKFPRGSVRILANSISASRMLTSDMVLSCFELRR